MAKGYGDREIGERRREKITRRDGERRLRGQKMEREGGGDKRWGEKMARGDWERL